MFERNGLLGRGTVKIAALLAIVALYGFARQPELPAAERLRLASRFDFTRLALAELSDQPRSAIRAVHPASRGSRPGSRASAPAWPSPTSTATAWRTTSATWTPAATS